MWLLETNGHGLKVRNLLLCIVRCLLQSPGAETLRGEKNYGVEISGCLIGSYVIYFDFTISNSSDTVDAAVKSSELMVLA